MKHALRVRIESHHPHRGTVEQLVQIVDDEDFDPEHRTVGNLVDAGWTDLLKRDENYGPSFLESRLAELAEDHTEDDRVLVYLDGKCVADEAAWHVDPNYFDLAWIDRHPMFVEVL